MNKLKNGTIRYVLSAKQNDEIYSWGELIIGFL